MEPTNTERAQRAADWVGNSMPDETLSPTEPISALAAALRNLMHYAHREGLDFNEAVTDAEVSFEDESCVTPRCMEASNDGEGFDGRCGTCADKEQSR